uniref:BK_channel_a domain-containing protein n=1 Tax=Macrostomum lignano TaxID=282301 RepID=A0A1I8FGQ0_9PLAT
MRVISIKNASPTTRCIIQLLQYHNKGYFAEHTELGLAIRASWRRAAWRLAFLYSDGEPVLYQSHVQISSRQHWEKDYQIGSAMEIYSEYFSDSFVGMPFQDAVEVSFNKLGILLFAMEDKSDDGDRFSVNQTQRQGHRHLSRLPRIFIADSQEGCDEPTCTVGSVTATLPSEADQGVQLYTRLRIRQVLPESIPGTAAGRRTNFARQQCQRSSARDSSSCLTRRARHTEGGRVRLRGQFWRICRTRKESVEYFDLTGMFHWCPDKNFEDVMLTPNSVARLDLRQHYVVIVFADSDSPLIGLRSFVMPLRASNFRLNELRPIVFIGNLDFLQREWGSLKNFPKIYMFPGSPMKRVILRERQDQPVRHVRHTERQVEAWKDQVVIPT